MPMDFYSNDLSSPCRAVRLVARALNVELNVKNIDVMKGEQLSPEFVKINPQHSIPTLVDGDLILSESRAIMGYLVDQYGKTDALYPKDAKQRAVVNQRLFFDSDTLYNRLALYSVPVIKDGAVPDKEKALKFEEALGFLNSFLEGKTWAAGNQKTIADYTLVTSVSTAEALGIRVNDPKFANVSAWYARAKLEMAGYEELNGESAKKVERFFKMRSGAGSK